MRGVGVEENECFFTPTFLYIDHLWGEKSGTRYICDWNERNHEEVWGFCCE